MPDPIPELVSLSSVAWKRFPRTSLALAFASWPTRVSFRERSSTFSRQAGCTYSLVCRSYEVYHHLAEQAGFRDLKLGWGVAEFRHKPQRWKREHRFIAIRRPLPVDPEESTQLTLFKDTRYSYSILVTNLDINPWKVWNDYLQRSNIERSIRELLNDLALSKIPTHTWTANVAFFQLLLFAYNLLHWFKRLCFPEPLLGMTTDTLRHQFLELPGKLNYTAGKTYCCFPKITPIKAHS